MGKQSRIGLWLLCAGISIAVALVMSPWSVLACFGCFCMGIAVSLHRDKSEADAN